MMLFAEDHPSHTIIRVSNEIEAKQNEMKGKERKGVKRISIIETFPKVK